MAVWVGIQACSCMCGSVGMGLWVGLMWMCGFVSRDVVLLVCWCGDADVCVWMWVLVCADG